MKKVILVLMILAVIFVVLPACAKQESTPTLTPTLKEIELKHDDGQSDGFQGLGGLNRGFLVGFFSPLPSLTITKIKIFGKLVGSGYENRIFNVLIWDEHQEELYSGFFSHTRFGLSPSWVEIDAPDVLVKGHFSVVVITNTPRNGGVYLYYDSDVENEHSALVERQETKDWYLKAPEGKINWMIRVVGTIEE